MQAENRQNRRALIADAVLRIVANQGLGKSTLRSVAGEADVSMGMVQHYFPSTEMLLHDSLAMGLADLRSRIDHRAAQALPSQEPQAVIKAVALAHLDENDEGVARLLRAIAQFRATSEHDSSVKALILDNDTHYISTITHALVRAQERRLLHRLVDPRLEGPVFWVLIDSLATDVALGLRGREEARSLLKYHFVRLARNARVTQGIRRHDSSDQ